MKDQHESYFLREMALVKKLKKRFTQSMVKKTEEAITEMDEIILEDYQTARILLEN